MNLFNKTIVVTGGTRGIGKEMVRLLLSKGANVIATGQTEPSIQKAKLELPEAKWLILDQSNLSGIRIFTEELQTRCIDVLINNAGVQQLRSFTDKSQELSFSTEKESNINFVGPVELTAELLPRMKSSPRAQVVFVTSGLALAPKRSSPVYCATKAALRSFVKSLRAQMEATRTPVSIVEALPPLVDTDMTRGRGKKKMTAAEAARQIVDGIEKEKKEIYVGMARLLKVILRISPSLGESIMIKM